MWTWDRVLLGPLYTFEVEDKMLICLYDMFISTC